MSVDSNIDFDYEPLTCFVVGDEKTCEATYDVAS